MRLTGFENALFSWKLATLWLWQPRITRSRPPSLPPANSRVFSPTDETATNIPLLLLHAHPAFFLSLLLPPPFSSSVFQPLPPLFFRRGFSRLFFLFFFLYFFFPSLPLPAWLLCFACTREDNRKNARRINISRICIAFYRLNPAARKLVVKTIPLGAIVLSTLTQALGSSSVSIWS